MIATAVVGNATTSMTNNKAQVILECKPTAARLTIPRPKATMAEAQPTAAELTIPRPKYAMAEAQPTAAGLTIPRPKATMAEVQPTVGMASDLVAGTKKT